MLGGMIRQPFDHVRARFLIASALARVRLRVAGLFPKRPAIAVPGAGGRLLGAWAGIVVGLVGQLVLLWLSWQLVDLVFSLMELWAELAAVHLRITLDTTR
jgi:hypothetical protein